MELLIKILETLSTKKKFWLTPIIVVLIILIGLMVLTQGSLVAPFIYTFF